MITVIELVEFVFGAVLFLARIYYLIYKIIYSGRSMARREGEEIDRSAQLLFLPRHKKMVRRMLWWMAGLVVFLEINLRILGIVHLDLYKIIHIFIAVTSFTLLLITALFFNGEKKPHLHRWFAYTSCTLFLIATLTGIPMFLEDILQKIRSLH